VRKILEYAREKNGTFNLPPLTLRLEKHLPSGAGMGGGSPDCVAAMKLLRKVLDKRGIAVPDDSEMIALAATLGADCPIFVDNRPAYAEGIGEVLAPMDEILKGKWLVIVKPDIFISTAAAFAGIKVRKPEVSLRRLIELPVDKWKDTVVNDFESSLFPKYPELEILKEALYKSGAEYASMTGSGAALYGIFNDKHVAERSYESINAPYKTLLML
ncbi:MAG: hypothetical protein K2J15_05750, partial [Muribaculaceae bacterium]|nr:hypothetical protein [Muribaculaceae bacterium]